MPRSYTFYALSTFALFGCSGITEDSGNTDDSGEARVPMAIDCTTITSLNRTWGGSSGPCGPEYVLTVDDTGAVSTSATEAYPPEGETDCETVTSDSSIEATEAEARKHVAAYPEIHVTSAEKGMGIGELRAAVLADAGV